MENFSDEDVVEHARQARPKPATDLDQPLSRGTRRAVEKMLATTTQGRLMRLEERVVGDVIVLAPSGRMTRDENFGAVKQRVHDLVAAGRRKLVLNLGAVSYMDSTCLGEIVSGFVTMRKQGGTLHLANLTERAERLMRIAQLTSVFQTFGSEQEAVRSLAPGLRES